MARAKSAPKETNTPPSEAEANAKLFEDALSNAGYARGEDGVWRCGDSAFIMRPHEPEDETPRALSFADVPQLDANHLTGQLGDFLLDQVKHARHMKPWDRLEEFEQRQLIQAADGLARELVNAVVQAVAGKGFESIDATLENFTGKTGGELSFKLNAALTQSNLARLAGKGTIVQIVFADAAAFTAKMLSTPSPDQPELIDASEDADFVVDGETGEVIPARRAAPSQQQSA